MSSSKVARRYSKALIALCDQDNSHEQLATELASFIEAVETNTEIASFVSDPSIHADSRKAVVKELCSSLKLGSTATNLFYLLNERERLNEASGILEDFRERLDEKAGRLRAVVTSATPLSDKDVQQLKASLEKTSGKTVLIETTVDPDLLGGVVTKVGNIVLDGSVRSTLSSLRKQMLQAAH